MPASPPGGCALEADHALLELRLAPDEAPYTLLVSAEGRVVLDGARTGYADVAAGPLALRGFVTVENVRVHPARSLKVWDGLTIRSRAALDLLAIEGDRATVRLRSGRLVLAPAPTFTVACADLALGPWRTGADEIDVVDTDRTVAAPKSLAVSATPGGGAALALSGGPGTRGGVVAPAIHLESRGAFARVRIVAPDFVADGWIPQANEAMALRGEGGIVGGIVGGATGGEGRALAGRSNVWGEALPEGIGGMGLGTQGGAPRAVAKRPGPVPTGRPGGERLVRCERALPLVVEADGKRRTVGELRGAAIRVDSEEGDWSRISAYGWSQHRTDMYLVPSASLAACEPWSPRKLAPRE